jgi:DNA-binding CsgD family transcriptional regulator
MTHERTSSDPGGMADGPASDDGGELRPALLGVPAALLVVTAALIVGDLVGDARAGSSGVHLALEAAAVAVGFVGGGWLWLQFLVLRRRARSLGARLSVASTQLTRARADAERFRLESEEAVRGLGAAIDRQFERWQLSSAEREVALLLLKGLPTKEIAAVRETSERTARQQALAVYRKAGLSGRAELAAFFLEDLLLPER